MSALGSRAFVFAILGKRAVPAGGSADNATAEPRVEDADGRFAGTRVARIVIQADGASWDEDTAPATPWARTRAEE